MADVRHAQADLRRRRTVANRSRAAISPQKRLPQSRIAVLPKMSMNSLLPLVGTAAVTENMLKRKWSTIILRHLSNGLNLPEDVIGHEPGLSPAILSERLRAMLRYGLIARFPRPGPSAVVEFRLTARGRKILKILDLIEQLDQLDRDLSKGNRTLDQQFGLQRCQRAGSRPPSEVLLQSARKTKPPNGAEMPSAVIKPILQMKTSLAPILCFLALTSASLFADNAAPNEPPAAASLQERAPTPESVLASQVSEIASASGLSHKEKEKRISNAVRLAITAAVADVKDPSQLVAIVTGLATAAAQGAPEYTQAIVSIVEDLPTLAQIDGAVDQIRAAILTAATDSVESGGVAHFASPPARPPANPEFGGSTTDVVVSRSH